LVIDTDGMASDVQIIKGLGLGLDENARDAVLSWRFGPAMLNGKAVPTGAMVELTFRPIGSFPVDNTVPTAHDLIGEISPKTQSTDTNLNGVWLARYNNAPQPNGEVRISQEGSSVTAVKTIGNEYVLAGEVSWTGVLSGNTGSGTAHTATMANGLRVVHLIPVRIDIPKIDTIVVTFPDSLHYWLFIRRRD
jgi:hypothetical protein